MKYIMMFMLMLSVSLVSGCVSVPTAKAVLTAADVGISIARSIKAAKKENPTSLRARLPGYADDYCTLRARNNWAWVDVRQAAIDYGAPEWAVVEVKTLIDQRCGDG